MLLLKLAPVILVIACALDILRVSEAIKVKVKGMVDKDRLVKSKKPPPPTPPPSPGTPTRIVGGKVTKPHEYPYHLGVLFDYRIGCGASIINKLWVLSAAHCFENVDPVQVQILAGDHSIGKDEGTEQLIQVVKIIDHEKYDRVTAKHDISVLKLEEPLKFNSNVQPVVLMPKNKVAYATGNGVVTGWGHTMENGSFSDLLRKVTVPFVPLPKCSKFFMDNADTEVGPGQVCAGGEAGKDACQGDSGGPLVMWDKQLKNVQVGISSFGAGCAHADFPGVYTDVAFYRDWIDKNTKI